MTEDVVISGLAIHLPGVNTLEKFATILFDGLPNRPKLKETVPIGYHGEFPAPAGMLTGTNDLDTIFFGMTSSVFLGVDRMQMKILETCYEALMDSGVSVKESKECLAQVYSSSNRADGEYADLSNRQSNYSMLGNSRALGPNRMSFHLDQKGHSVALDTGNVGGMQSLELGWRDIREGRADMAIICSGNLLIGESITAQMSNLGWISKKGTTCSFDNEADGFQRTEGCIALILQPAKTAKRIYAKINHVCCESVLNTLTSPVLPSKQCWMDFLENIYAKSGIDKKRIQFLEAHGAAVKDWDAAELNGVMEILGRERNDPLIVGSVKSNVGHAEGAADLVSIVKAIICLEHGKIPANTNYSSPNRAIPGLVGGKLKIADKNLDLCEDGLVAVNSYSHGNMYGHCILEGLRKPKVNSSPQQIPRLVALSARVDDLLPNMIHQIEEVPFDVDYINLIQEIFKDNIGNHLARGYTILPKQDQSFSYHQDVDGEKRPLWFVFSGMGSQWPGMGKDLMRLPAARSAIEKCHSVLAETGLNLIDILTSDDPTMFQQNLNSFVGIAAVQVSSCNYT